MPFGVTRRRIVNSSICQGHGAGQAVGALGEVRPRLDEKWSGVMILRLQAMFDDRLHGQGAGYFALFLAANTIGEYVEAERRFNLVGIFVVLTDTPDVRLCSNVNTQRVTSTLGWHAQCNAVRCGAIGTIGPIGMARRPAVRRCRKRALARQILYG